MRSEKRGFAYSWGCSVVASGRDFVVSGFLGDEVVCWACDSDDTMVVGGGERGPENGRFYSRDCEAEGLTTSGQ